MNLFKKEDKAWTKHKIKLLSPEHVIIITFIIIIDYMNYIDYIMVILRYRI